MRTSLQESFPVDFTGLTCVQWVKVERLNGGWARQTEEGRNGGGSGCSFQEKGLTRVKQSLTAEESDGVGGGGGGRRKGWTERNVITQSRSLG